MTFDEREAAALVERFLHLVDHDPARLARTPERVAAAAKELFAGSGIDPVPALREGRFPAEGSSGQPVALRGIAFRSMCEHHMLPFEGSIDLVYVPGDHLVGFGRLHALVETLSSQLTLQEVLADRIVQAIMAGLDARGALVRVTARQGCVTLRGERQVAGDAVSIAAAGELREGAARSEAMLLLGVAEPVAALPDAVGDAIRGGATVTERPTSAASGADAAAAAPRGAAAGPFLEPELMAVLNVTPDSFSDGGRFERDNAEARTEAALEVAHRLIAEGATIIDVGGESTRPGAQRVPQPEECARVLPVVAALADEGIEVSVDTMYAETARAVLDAGARYVNDVSGGMADAEMLPLMAETGAPYILSHWRGHSILMNNLAEYCDAGREILDELLHMRDQAVQRGLSHEQIILDPGLGFAKDAEHNWAVLGMLEAYQSTGHPLLIGVSRKRFTGALLPEGAPVLDRDLPTAIISAFCAERGVWGVRVHNALASKVAFDVARGFHDGSVLGPVASSGGAA